MPYIAKIRTDIPDGTLQILDLQPNDSQRNYIYDPPAQAKYARRPDNDRVLTLGAGPILTAAEYSGVSAWLIDHIEDTPNGDALTAAQVETISAALIAQMDAGLVLNLAAVNGIIAATVAGSGIGVGNSTGTLAELLEVMTGAVYTVPAGAVVDTDGATYNQTTLGSLTHSRHIVHSGPFNISRGEGKLSEWTDAGYTYRGVTGAALVLYADDGSLL